MISKYLLITLLILLVSCSRPDSVKSSALATVNISEGMPRKEVEELIAKALLRKSDYSAYGNNLLGGVVEYIDGDTVLEVTYKSGAPAPWILDAKGNVQHSPPADETVFSSRLYSRNGQ